MTEALTIGKFEIRKKLGRDASGTVYLALDTFSGEDVALKVFDPEILSGPDIDKTRMILKIAACVRIDSSSARRRRSARTDLPYEEGR